MPVYEVDATKLKVEHQDDSFLCWAATTKAVAEYFGLVSPNQQGLGAWYPNKATGNDPTKVLADKFNVSATQLIDWKTKPGSDLDQRKAALRTALAGNLSAASGPMLCGLTEADDVKWVINLPSGGTKDYLFLHATLLFKFDSDTDMVWFADPAQPVGKPGEVKLSIAELVGGFAYIAVADLGPKAQKIVPTGLTDVKLRIYKLESYKK